jgi:amino acid permease
MEKSIGNIYGDISNLLIVFMLIFVVIAFMILEKDIAGDIIDYFIGEGDYGRQYKSIILIILTVFSFPVMIAKSLYALRNVSFLGTFSVGLLLIVIIIKSVIFNYRSPESFSNYSRPGPENIGDVLYALPIILIAFLW